MRVRGPAGAVGTVFGLSLLIPLEKQLSVSRNLSHRRSRVDAHTSATHGPSGESSMSWRALGGERSGQTYAEGAIAYQGMQGQLNADIHSSSSQSTLRLGAQGALVVIGGEAFASRTLQDTFALVEVPGYAGAGVGFHGNMLARTNPDGKALLPRLQAYQANSIRLNPSELPISAELDSIEQIATPGHRSGVIVKFPVRSGRGALIKIVFDGGEPRRPGHKLSCWLTRRRFMWRAAARHSSAGKLPTTCACSGQTQVVSFLSTCRLPPIKTKFPAWGL